MWVLRTRVNALSLNAYQISTCATDGGELDLYFAIEGGEACCALH